MQTTRSDAARTSAEANFAWLATSIPRRRATSIILDEGGRPTITFRTAADSTEIRSVRPRSSRRVLNMAAASGLRQWLAVQTTSTCRIRDGSSGRSTPGRRGSASIESRSEGVGCCGSTPIRLMRRLPRCRRGRPETGLHEHGSSSTQGRWRRANNAPMEEFAGFGVVRERPRDDAGARRRTRIDFAPPVLPRRDGRRRTWSDRSLHRPPGSDTVL